jgi:hypothetical protein
MMGELEVYSMPLGRAFARMSQKLITIESMADV